MKVMLVLLLSLVFFLQLEMPKINFKEKHMTFCNVLNEILPSRTIKHLRTSSISSHQECLICICECNAQLFYFVTKLQKT